MDLLQVLRRFNWVLFVCACLLALLGITFIHSTTYREYSESADPTARSFLSGLAWRQTQWLVVSLAAFIVAAVVDYRTWHRWAYMLFGACLVALVLLIPFGVTRGGSRRWFHVGPFLVQPSEFMKIAVILALARYLMFRKNYRTLRGLIYPFLFAMIPMLFILKQPDLGTSLVFLPLLFAMLYVAGSQPRHLAAVGIAGLLCMPVIWFFYMSPAQKSRIMAFIDPHSDPSGAGYHLIESLIAIGTGGLTGHGYMQGPQNLLNKVPALHTDFVFTAVCEEWGFLGGSAVVVLYIVLFHRMFALASHTREPFGRLVAVGGATLLAFQTIVNIGMTMRLCPITGLTLPFISYGGSSLLTCFIILGLIVGIDLHPKVVMAPADDLA